MMGKPTRPKKRKRKIRIKQKVAIVRKDSIRSNSAKNDTLRKAPTKTVLPTNGVTFKVKLRKK